jgi:hypothetical protein
MQPYAGSANDEHKSKIKSDRQTDKKSASQHLDQDNFCYRGAESQQANQSQQTVDEDKEAKGFNNQSLNIDDSTGFTD